MDDIVYRQYRKSGDIYDPAIKDCQVATLNIGIEIDKLTIHPRVVDNQKAHLLNSLGRRHVIAFHLFNIGFNKDREGHRRVQSEIDTRLHREVLSVRHRTAKTIFPD